MRRVYLMKLEISSALCGRRRTPTEGQGPLREYSSLYRGDMVVLVRAVSAESARERVSRLVVIATADDVYRAVLREYAVAEVRLTRALKYEGVGMDGAPVIVRATLDGYPGVHAGKFLVPGAPIRVAHKARSLA